MLIEYLQVLIHFLQLSLEQLNLFTPLLHNQLNIILIPKVPQKAILVTSYTISTTFLMLPMLFDSFIAHIEAIASKEIVEVVCFVEGSHSGSYDIGGCWHAWRIVNVCFHFLLDSFLYFLYDF